MQKNSIQNMMIIKILFKKKKTEYINKLNTLAFHKQLSKTDLNNSQMDFDATSLYASAMWDKN